LDKALDTLSRWSRPRPKPSKEKNVYYRPSLDGLEVRFLPATILSGNQLILGLNDGGSFVTPNAKGEQVGLQFGGVDFLSPGIPLGGFAVSVNNQTYFNSASQIGLPGTLADMSTPGTLAYRFTSEAIPGLRITRDIAMPLDSRQILVSMPFDNIRGQNGPAKSFSNIATMEIDDADPSGFTTINDVLRPGGAVFARSNSGSGLTLGLFSLSSTSFATILGDSSGVRLTDHDPLKFLPAPFGTLAGNAGDPDGAAEDASIRLAQAVSTLSAGDSAIFHTTLFVGEHPSQVDSEATKLAEYAAPRGEFGRITTPRNQSLSTTEIQFSQPVVGLGIEDLALTRDGVPVSLEGVRLQPLEGGKGLRFRIVGLGDVTGTDGEYRLTLVAGADVRDLAGRTLAQPPVLAWSMDTAPPSPPIFAGLSPDTGASSSDLLTNASLITLTGFADPGDRVEISLSNGGSGQGKLLAAPTADASGAWSITLETSNLPEGKVVLQALSIDTGGNRSEEMGLFTFTLDLTAPGLPGLPSVLGDSGTDSQDRVTSNSTPAFQGFGEPGTTIQIRLVGQDFLASTTVAPDGSWNIAWPEGYADLADGVHQFEVSSVDAAGNRSEIRAFSVTTDTTPPGSPLFDGSIPGLVGIEGGFLSNGQAVVLAGAAEPGTQLSLSLDGQILGQVLVNESGRWTFSLQPKQYADGAHTLAIQSVDLAGNQSPEVFAGFVVDTQPPAMPKIVAVVGDSGRSATDGVTQDPVIVLTGEAEPGALVEVSLAGQGVVGTVRAAANGTWTLETPGPAPDGVHGFTARAMDPAGNLSPWAEPFEVLVDTISPVSPIVRGVRPDTATVGDGITSDNRLVLFGEAEPHALIEVAIVGIGFAGSVTTDSNGTWYLDLSELNLADGALSFVARAVDIAGNTSSPGGPFEVILDSLPPGSPTILSATGDPDGDRISLDNTPDFEGTAEPFSLVELSLSGLGVVGSVRADSQGRWTLAWNPELAALSEGGHALSATATDAAGNTSGASATFEIWIDTLAPELPVIEKVDPDTGLGADDRVTFEPIPALMGQAEPGSILTLRQIEKGWIIQVQVGLDGSWRGDFSHLGSLGDGRWTFVARATDTAGNQSAWTEPFSVLIDTVPPEVPGFVGLLDDTGRDPADRVTSNRSPGLSGKAEPGAAVYVFKDGLEFARVFANESGQWVLDMSTQPLGEGEHQFRFQSEDQAGNRSLMSPVVSVRVDTTSPVQAAAIAIDPRTGDKDGLPLVNRRSVSLRGLAEADSSLEFRLNGSVLGGLVTTTGTWNLLLGDNLPEGTHTVSVRVVDRAGNTSSWSDYQFEVDTIAPAAPVIQKISPDTGADPSDRHTSANRVTLSGTAEPFSELRLRLDGLAAGVVRTDSQGRWEYALPNQLGDGRHLVQVSATDRAGNTSSTNGEITFSVDTVPPTAPSIDGISPDTGVHGDGLVNTRLLTLRGRAEAFARVEVFSGAVSLGSALSNSQGEWTLSLAKEAQAVLREGRNGLVARATDTAGNTGTDSAGYDLVLDTQKPGVPTLERIEADTGAPGDFLTSDERPALLGQAEPFSTVRILLGGNVLGVARADVLGNWSFRPADNLSLGGHTFQFQAIDVAGNTGDLSRGYLVQINTDIPPAPVILGFSPNTGSEIDWITSAGQIVLRGTAKVGSRVEILVGGVVIGTTNPDNRGSWSFAVPGNLAQGQYRIQARSISQSGLESALSQTEILEVDSTAPAVPVIDAVVPDTGDLGNDLVTGATNLVLKGRAEPGSRVEIRIGGVPSGTTEADAQGFWQFSLGESAANRVYQIGARSIDPAGNSSDWSRDARLVVDTRAPVVQITKPESGGVFNESTWSGGISGFVSRDEFESDIAKVSVSLLDRETGFYFDGQGFQSTTPVFLTATLKTVGGRVEWRLDLPSSRLQDAHGYEVRVTALDLAGNASEGFASATFRFDLNAPTTQITPSNQGVSLNFAPITFDIRFSEAIQGLDGNDFVLPGGARVLSIVGDKDRWTVTIQPGPAGGEFEGTFLGEGVTDLAGNHPDSVTFAFRVNVGDTLASALAIQPKSDGSFSFQGKFDSVNAIDWFQLPLPEGGKGFEARIQGVSSAVLATWYDASGNLLASTRATSQADGFLRIQPDPQARFLRIQPLEAGAVTPYQLVLTPIDPIVDAQGNSLDRAQLVALTGNLLQASGERLTLGDSDYIRFSATATGYLDAVASPGKDSAVKLQLIALDSRGRVVSVQAPGEHGDSAVVRFPVIAGRDYYLRVEGLGEDNGLGATGAWTIQGKLNLATDATTATLGTGEPMRLDAAGGASLRGGVDLPGDGDLVVFQAEAAGNMLLRMNPRVTSPNLVPRILVLDQNFQLVDQAQGRAGLPLTANIHLPGSGLYYFRFASLSGSTGGFEGELHQDDVGSLEKDAAGLLPDGPRQTASGSIDLAGDRDLFRFVAQKTGLYQIILKGIDGSTEDFGFAAGVGSVPGGTATQSVGKVFVDVGETLFLRVEGINGASGKYQLDLLPTEDDHSDYLDPTKATKATLSGRQSGRLESFGDRDVFSWTAPSDTALMPEFGAYFASARSDSASVVDTFITLYRILPDGKTEKVTQDNDSFLGSDAVVFFQAEPGQSYLFEVKGAQTLETGSYTFQVGEDRLEPGDDNPSSFQLARLVEKFQLDKAPDMRIQGVIEPESDLEIFRFVPTQSGQWVLRVDAAGASQLDPYLTLFDSSFAQIMSDDNAGPGSGALVLGNLVAGREYFLSVSSTSGTGTYTLQAQPFRVGTGIGNDDFPADKPGLLQAPISEGSKVSGSVDFVGDTDTFVLQWPAHVGNATLLARLEAASKSALDPMLEILDEQGRVLFTSDNTGSSLASTAVFDIDPGQKLLLRVSGANKSLGNYSFRIDAIKQPEGDDHTGSPAGSNMASMPMVDITNQENSSVRIFSGKLAGVINQLGDRDFVKVVAPMEGMLTATVRRDKGTILNPNLKAYIKNPEGDGFMQVAFDDDSLGGLDSKLQIRVTEGQEVFLLTSGTAGTTGSYAIETVVRPDDIGGLPTTGLNLRLEGLRAHATGTLETGGDTDLFLYTPTQSGSITVRLHALSPGLNPFLFVYQAKDGALLTSNNDISASQKDSQVQLQVEAGETYYLSARSAGSTFGEYELEVTPVVDDYASSQGSARLFPLAAGNVGALAGRVEAIGDSDWFRILPVEDGILRLRIDGVGSGGVDPTLAVFNDAGQLLGFADDFVTDGRRDPAAELSVPARSGRSLFVRAMGYGESTGTYQLTVQAGTRVSDDFPSTIDTAELMELDNQGKGTFEGLVSPGDTDVVRLIATQTGDLVVRYRGELGTLRAVVREEGELVQIASGNLNARGGTLRFHVVAGQDVYLLASGPEDTKKQGGAFEASVELIGEALNQAKPVGAEVVSALDGTLNQAFTQLIGQGQTETDFQNIRDQITSSLVASFLAASGGALSTSYLVIWLDPVDFVVTDAASQQIGNTASQGAMRENASATLSQKGALDLVIIPGASAGNFSMQLIGVGGGRVLAGATMIQQDGTVLNPKVTVNGIASDSGIPTGSVPKEGLTLNLDFRGEQRVEPPASGPSAVATLSNAAQQIVGSLLTGMGQGVAGLGDAALASADLAATELITMLIGPGGDFVSLSSDGRLLDPPVWATKEGRELAKLITTFALEINDSVQKGIQLLVRDGSGPGEEVLGLLKNALVKLGFDQADTVVASLGEEARSFVSVFVDGSLQKELVQKPISQFFNAVSKELDKSRVNKTPSNEAGKTAQKPQPAPVAPAKTVSSEAQVPSGTTTPLALTPLEAISAEESGEWVEPIDQFWLEEIGLPGVSGPTTAMANTATMALNDAGRDGPNSDDRFWGLVAAAMLAPSWVSSGPVQAGKKVHRPLRVPSPPPGGVPGEKETLS